MKQYQMIETKTQMMFIVKGVNAKDCCKQIKHQIGDDKAKLIIISAKRTH